MKNLHVILLLLICNAFFSQKKDQSFIATYKVTFVPKKGNEKKKTEHMFLEVNNNVSKFGNADMAKIDSLIKINDSSIKEDSILPYLNFKVYKNLSHNDVLLSGNFNQFIYTFKEENVKWEFIKMKPTKLEGYNIKEATTEYGGRKWIVLYTEDISIFNGPYVFHGLPGLVYKAMSEDRDYIFELVGIKKIKNTTDIILPKANITKQKIINSIKNFLKDPAKQNITYKNIWGDTFYYEYSKSSPETALENESRIKKIIENFNNPIDKDLFIINLQ